MGEELKEGLGFDKPSAEAMAEICCGVILGSAVNGVALRSTPISCNCW